MNWEAAINIVQEHVVRIETPTGYGTGFLAFYNHDAAWCGVATAAHVVSHADEWQQPIKVRNVASPEPKFLTPTDRIIFVDHSNDSAVVLFVKGDFQLPQIPIGLMPPGQPESIGIDVGWLGYPNIEPNTLCFFAGTVSARQEARKGYLIDGVAINGVSGGPVFHCPSPGEVQIIGCVSAYHANRATGEALPGLLRAQDVSHFRGVAERIRNIDEANAQKQAFEEEQRAKEEQTKGETSALKSPEADDDWVPVKS
ncbi:S1 family peptidase [Bradyrhizobium diazoefficiens]|uniref:S1 family peptidase n=1 Tax=Bradyrhizobium diazoefficiens TaxID=1355477 RepID=UPI002714D1D1|nr:serine protease [Bradyrhizobium diazoefficiens]WLB34996.1 serine protease [Bradyrhizobium diazoefficiens]WLC20006.1 serine protease [Bradyrhizobium diazoefficiens]